MHPEGGACGFRTEHVSHQQATSLQNSAGLRSVSRRPSRAAVVPQGRCLDKGWLQFSVARGVVWRCLCLSRPQQTPQRRISYRYRYCIVDPIPSLASAVLGLPGGLVDTTGFASESGIRLATAAAGIASLVLTASRHHQHSIIVRARRRICVCAHGLS